MLIICPKCFTRFEAPSSLIKKQTQKFKCSTCGEVFEEHFSDVVELTQKAHEISENSDRYARPMPENLTPTERDAFAWNEGHTHPVPEEFTPVFDQKKKSYGWIFWLIVLCAIAGIGGYGYVNRAELLSSFPDVQKGLDILSTPEEVNPGADPLKIYPTAETPLIQSEMSDSLPEAPTLNVDAIPATVLTPATPVLGQQAAPEMLGDGVLQPTETSNDKLNLPAPQVADTVVSVAADKASIQIKDVVFRLDDTGTGMGRLFVQGIVNNVTEGVLPMPALQAQLYDKDNVLLGVRDLPHTPRQLNGKMAEFFFAEVDQLPSGIVSRISVVIKGK